MQKKYATQTWPFLRLLGPGNLYGPYVAENSKNVGWGDSPKDTETVADLHTR